MKPRCKILLIEDNPADIRLARVALESAGFDAHVHSATNGEDALAYLHRVKRKPDLVLLDLNLPRKDGREVLSEIRDDTAFEELPVVIITTSSAEEDVLWSYSRRANCFITKPLNLDEFVRAIHGVLKFWLGTFPRGRKAYHRG